MRACFHSLAVIAILAGARGAHAEPGTVVVSGTASARDRKVAADAAEASAGQSGIVVKVLSKPDAEIATKCASATGAGWHCMPPSLAKGEGKIVVVDVNPQRTDNGGETMRVAVRVFVPGTDTPVVKEQFCDHCTDDTLAKTVGELTTGRLHAIAVASNRTVIAFSSVPKGAMVTLDGTKLNIITDDKVPSYPGKHVAVFELSGYGSQTLKFEAVDGQTAEVTATLKANAGGSHGDPTVHGPDPRHTNEVPAVSHAPAIGVLVGAGVLVATGVVLVAVDQDPSPSHGKHIYNTAPLGVGVVIVGLVGIGVGAYLWHREAASSGPVAAVGAHDAIVGWAGRF